MRNINFRSSTLVLLAACAISPAFAGVITFTCNANIDAANAGTCATLNTTTAGLYSSTFTNATAAILIRYGATGLGSSTGYFSSVTYANYYNALDGLKNGADDISAVASLGGSAVNPVSPGSDIYIPSALQSNVGLGAGVGIDAAEAACFTIGSAGCYNGIITLSSAASFFYRSGVIGGSEYDFFTVTEHEINEVLGFPSCITTGAGPAAVLNAGCTSATSVGASDLFRYSANGVRSFVAQGNGTVAYLSQNGGLTNIAGFNNTPNGGDYADFDGSSVSVQNAFSSPGTSGLDNGSAENRFLDIIGYTRVAAPSGVPEPGTTALLGSGLALLLGLSRRLRKA